MLNIEEIAKMENIMKPLAQKVCSNKYIVLYGLSFYLRSFWKNFLDWFGKPILIIDRNARNNEVYEGIPVLKTVAEISNEIKNNCIILICAVAFREEIYNELVKYIKPDKIFKYPSIITDFSPYYKDFLLENDKSIQAFYAILADDLSKNVFEDWLKGKITCDRTYFCRNCIPNNYVNINQLPLEMLRQWGYKSDTYFYPELGRAQPYDSLFCNEILKLNAFEIYFDCGAAYGDTYNGFVIAVNNQYKKIILLEPSEMVYNNLSNLVASEPRVQCIKCGVADSNSCLMIKKNAFEGGVQIDDVSKGTGSESINLKTIDSIAYETGFTPTLIKMDIEGTELSALKGAEHTIKTAKPKLIVCIYHKNEDIIEIPQYIYSLNPDYKMYVRHFDCGSSELVLFCV